MLRKKTESWTLKLNCENNNGLEQWFAIGLQDIKVSVIFDNPEQLKTVYRVICPYCGQVMDISKRKIPRRIRNRLLKKYN